MERMKSKNRRWKTNVLWCASSRRQHQIPDEHWGWARTLFGPSGICSKFGNSSWLRPVNEHARHTNCFLLFAARWQIRSISRSVSQSVVQSLIVSLVISRLDYGSATLAGLPACQLDGLQPVPNACGASDPQIHERVFCSDTTQSYCMRVFTRAMNRTFPLLLLIIYFA